LASYLEKYGTNVKVLDPLSQGKEDYFSESDYTGITCVSSQFQKARQIAKKVKTKNPETITILGGVHPTVATEETSSDPNVNIAVVGEGEKALLKIVKEKIEKGVVHGELVQDLDEIPFPARHLINMDWYLKRSGVVFSKWIKATSVMTSRGCPNDCHFCINSKHAMFGRKVRYHSVEYVEKEVEELVSKYGIEGIFFVDDNFVLNKKRLAQICGRIKRFDLKWMCQSRIDTLSRQSLEVMKDCGCVTVGFGVESGSQRVLNALNKNVAVENAIKAFDLCHQVGVKAFATIMIGNPEETKEDLELTDKLLERIKPDYLEIFYLTPFQGTVLYDRAIENGWLIKENTNWMNSEPQLEISFTLEELEEIKKYLIKKRYSRLRWLRLHSENPYFMYDVLMYLARKPSFLFKWMKGERDFFER
jgi:radical SAM superfamily enzyme YgiQ (UPF0313 family)